MYSARVQAGGAAAGVRSATARYTAALHAAAYTRLGEILTATLPDVPRDTGELRESVFLEAKSPAVGGFGAEHAAAQHEIPSFHPRGGKWKFLQTKLNDLGPQSPARMATLVEQYARAGTTLANVPRVHAEVPRTTGGGRPRLGARRR